MTKVSMIIPVYQVEDYIENSLKTVCAQTYKDFEVIIVDNNSTDNSIKIADEILSKSGLDYKIVKQPKQGLPAARNKGIQTAEGEWVISIDPDDTVAPNFIEEFVNCVEKYKVNIVFSKYDEITIDSLFLFPECQLEDRVKVFAKEEIMDLLLRRVMPLMVSNMFIRKSIFTENDLWFDENVMVGADLLNLWKLLPTQKEIAFIDKTMYNHFFRPDSLMTNPSVKKHITNKAGYARTRDFYAENYDAKMGDLIYARAVYASISSSSIFGSYHNYMEFRKNLWDKEVYSILKTFPDKKIVMMSRILNVAPWLFFFINKTLRKPNSFASKIVNSTIR